MASSSNTDATARTQEDLEYSSALNCTVSNFVSVKLSSDRNYHLWEMQMLCLLDSYNMQDVLDAAFNGSMRKQFDSLVKGCRPSDCSLCPSLAAVRSSPTAPSTTLPLSPLISISK
ncbi:unnamed protein product [Lactuca virosa]|uniref:Retrotransposon Copia-like N-terminal domain-containing protein n=1 Tax=Lactuca virosa TaxID=75947 RepID=A0AAU9PGY3_9ASTR|nr:unnamed protein product [Lactuca virosa]